MPQAVETMTPDVSAEVDTFTAHYIRAMLWSTNDESDERGGEPLDANYDADDITRETLSKIIADCRRFQEENAADIAGNDEQAGHDFWLTRNGHGAGFWDGDWPKESGQRLTKASEAFGVVYLYVGDDDKLHI